MTVVSDNLVLRTVAPRICVTSLGSGAAEVGEMPVTIRARSSPALLTHVSKVMPGPGCPC